jgi:tRNA dimethylallyltransferase
MAGLILIAGPTASGKSSLALRLAEAEGGVVINADSMQLYRDLAVLTARPGPAEEARAPHRLYGILDAAVPASVAMWLELAGREIETAAAADRLAVVVGGTGLYLHALLHGLAPVPEVPDATRKEAMAMLRSAGSAGLHAELARRDPAMAARLRPNDRQRVLRAYEVLAATGRSLAAWQALPPLRVALPERRAGFVLMPPRAFLYERIARRLRAMIEAGALEEVAALRARSLDPALPAMKALAVPQLCAHLDGRLDLEPALADAIMQTRRYAKRQLTWFRHRLPELQPLDALGEDHAAMPGADQVGRLLLTGTAGHHSVRCTKKPGS